ncbi:DUF4238 domain-containing protein [Bradyrhizobium sp. SZCCHNR1051]|uniref:DUF4238 domain-containing protein n=1 Tax=Bradyrhizobium sp. SZCCHNR1051 TaxID=3057355 RepID=UPI002916687B|nr:DUF4238 domain-containing protein [Bradyrhizobium sp. SZCCHNR1051]
MADNKNQHYVPRVHLKPFTLDGKGLAINLLNIDRMKPIRGAPVKNQCSGDYFYGKDESLERAISAIEGPYGEIVRILSVQRPTVSPKARVVLLRFVLLQYLRTEAASRKATEMTNAICNVPGSDIEAPPIREAIKAAVRHAMLTFAHMMRVVDDLKVCILSNHTDRPFVTSDNPAVLTNRLHIQRRNNRRSFGVTTAGTIFLLPLSPRLSTIIYDPAVYHSSQQAGVIDVMSAADIDATNEHQILNCAANLYFKDWEQREQLIQHAVARRERRPKCRHAIVHAALDHSTEWGRHYSAKDVKDLQDEEEVLVHIRENHAQPSAWPSFLRFRPDAKAYSNNSGTGLTRKSCIEHGFVTGTGYEKVRV